MTQLDEQQHRYKYLCRLSDEFVAILVAANLAEPSK